MNNKLAFAILSLLCTSLLGFSQQLDIETISLEGVSSFTYDIEQTSAGHLIVASDRDLYSFDGEMARKFGIDQNGEEPLPIQIERFKQLMVVDFYDHGLGVLDLDNNTKPFQTYFSSSIVRAVRANSNHCWALVSSDSLFKYNEQNHSFSLDKVLPIEALDFLVFDEEIALFTKKGIHFLDLNNPSKEVSFVAEEVETFTVYNHLLFVVTKSRKLLVIDLLTKQTKAIGQTQFYDVSDVSYIPRERALIISSITSGLEFYTLSNEHLVIDRAQITEQNGLPFNSVKTLFVDHDQELWIGGFGFGLAHLPSTYNRTLQTKHPITSYALVGDEIALASGTQINWYKFHDLSKSKTPPVLFKEEVTKILPISQEKLLLVLGFEKMILMSLKEGNQVPLSFTDWNPIRINDLQHKGDTLLIASDNGLGIYTFTNQQLKTYSIAQGLPSNKVLTAQFKSKGNRIAVGLDGGGATEILPNGLIKLIEMKVNNFRVNNLIQSRDYDCITTIGDGLLCLTHAGYKPLTNENIKVAEEKFFLNTKPLTDSSFLALTSTAVSVFTFLDSNYHRQVLAANQDITLADVAYKNNRVLYVENQRLRVVACHLEDLRRSNSYRTLVSQAFLNGNDYQIEPSINLSSGSYHISLLLNTPNFGHNFTNRYYKLEGYDVEWNVIEKRNYLISFPQLRSGKYRLLVRNGLHGEPQEIWTLSIDTPIWQKWWFITLSIFLLLLILFSTFYIRERYHNRLRSYLQYQIKKHTRTVREQSEMLEEQNREILESIHYAKRIQDAIQPTKLQVRENFKDSFLLYKPKDIVAGDFYWMTPVDSGVLFAAADCTGHGVSGAMVSIVCNGALNDAVLRFGLLKPNEILDLTRELVVSRLKTSGAEVRDGMDISLIYFEKETSTVYYSGAYNPLWVKTRIGRNLKNTKQIVTNDQCKIVEFAADRQPVGLYPEMKPFTLHSFKVEPEDSLYLFSDGIIDQFGGPKGRKLKKKNFAQFLIQLPNKSMQEQKFDVLRFFNQWCGNNEQIDDVIVVGLKLL